MATLSAARRLTSFFSTRNSNFSNISNKKPTPTSSCHCAPPPPSSSPPPPRISSSSSSPPITQTRKFQSSSTMSSSSTSSIPTADLCDANPTPLQTGTLRPLPPIFTSYGRRKHFSGQITTLRVYEDNVLVRDLLEQKGEGRVLLVDGGGSQRCALMGGNLAQHAQNNGWSGVVINGCIRDVDEINGCDVGVRAIGTNPIKSGKRKVGEVGTAVWIGGVRVCEGEWLYADGDGILVSRDELGV